MYIISEDFFFFYQFWKILQDFLAMKENKKQCYKTDQQKKSVNNTINFAYKDITKLNGAKATKNFK